MVNTRSLRQPAARAAGSRKSRKQARQYTEETLLDALRWYDEHPGESYKSTGELYGVPPSTLHSRHTRRNSSRGESHAHQQLLSPEEEGALCDWIEHLSYMGFPVDKDTLHSLVMQITGASRPPGENWHKRFLKRHPGVQLGKPFGLDPERARAFNRHTVDDYFKKLKAVIDEYNIPWSHVYNMDEKGIQRGGGRRLQRIKYFVPRGRRVNYKLRSNNLELITIIECISADGRALLPGFIFAGNQVPSDALKDIDPQVVVGHSPNGWTEGFLCTEWFRKCFLPQANAHRETDAPLLLILDGHNSHITPELRQLAIENNVHLFLLPPHTTHRLQPLDVGIFSHIQNAWVKRCNEHYSRSLGREMSRGQLIREYLALRQRVLKSSLIRKAWWNSGITSGTWSADFFSEEDFAPSYATSAIAHVPLSYPETDAGIVSADLESAHLPAQSPLPTPDDVPLHTPSSSRLCTPTPLRSPTRTLSRSPSPRSPSPSPGASLSGCSRASSLTTRTMLSQRLLSRNEEVQCLREENARLRKRNRELIGHAEHALAHASIAKWELQRIRDELYRKTSTKKRRNVRTSAALITAGEGAAQCERGEREAAEREERKQAEQARRAEEERNRQIQRERLTRDDRVTFSESLNRKVKEDLKDIAFALSLPLDGTNSELCARITEHLRSHAARYSTHPKSALST
ncbi:hypothetical protein NUW54_g10310 [Trametes sanguinea]|uniref:Uncharacterized protein n=1 Tax=Trametes sanguinea TaxID=158606 RepID=A0ACC1NZX6_9APHY|nr:hypothetical protein NUW54_g10310 [Trametes sanguinea]